VTDASELPALPPLAHNGWELATWVLIVIAMLLAFKIWTDKNSTKTLKGVASDLGAVKGQLVNDHPIGPGTPNMRDQLDRMESAIAGLRKDIGRIGDAALDDRETHRVDVARIDSSLSELWRRLG